LKSLPTADDVHRDRDTSRQVGAGRPITTIESMAYNLASPNGILEPVSFEDFPGWFARELKQISSESEAPALMTVADDLGSFIGWPGEALLLWPECDRIPPPGKKQKYFSYPDHIREMARAKTLALDTRPNGPAIASFLFAGGERPPRFGSSNAWSIHHLYSGKFPYIGRQRTTHAAKDCAHFTQSAGLVAAHPIADAMVDEFPFFTWLLRAHAFARFHYDPDGVFCSERDRYGFVVGHACRVITETELASRTTNEQR
jgi:hypothetical protein